MSFCDGISYGFGAIRRCLQIWTRALAFRCDSAVTQSNPNNSGVQVHKGTKHQTHARRKAYAPAGLQTLTDALQAMEGPREPSIVPQPYTLIQHGDTYRFDSDQ